MKKVGRFLFSIIIFAWLITAIFVTVCLLSYNQFRVTTFGKYSLIIVDSDELEPDYMEGDLLVVKRNSDNKIEVGDEVFFYNSAMNSEILLYHGKVQEKEVIDKNETTFIIDNEKVSGEYIAGKLDSSKVYHKVGSLLGVFTSKWGFMFLVIFPTLFAIIYEIIMIIESAKNMKSEEQE